MADLFQRVALPFVWQKNYDSPRQGYHADPRDTGGGTKGGVIETTWHACAARGLVTGTLAAASDEQLATVLRAACWQPFCDALPPWIAFLLFNGRMMSRQYVNVLQRGLGIPADGDFGEQTLAAARAADPACNAVIGIAHLTYLRTLWNWNVYGGGWANRILDAHVTAAGLVSPAPAGSPATQGT